MATVTIDRYLDKTALFSASQVNSITTHTMSEHFFDVLPNLCLSLEAQTRGNLLDADIIGHARIDMYGCVRL